MLEQKATTMQPVWATLCALALTLGATAISRAQSGPLEDLSTFPRTTVQILHGRKKQDPRNFDVWIADTPSRQEQGFMFVRDLAPGKGMLFPQKQPRKMSMWMKDTYIELDIVFISEKGAIEQIIEHAHPLSLQRLSSSKPVSAVLEIKGGEAQRLGLEVGDRVNWTAPD